MYEEELLDQLRSGDEATQKAATAALFREHQPAALRAARALTRNEQDAEDLVSEGFAKVFASVQAGGGPTSAFRPYLMVTMRRVGIDLSRRKSSQEIPSDEVTLVADQQGFNPDVQDLITERTLLQRAMSQMPERWQSVLWFMNVEGESAATVGARMGMSANAVAALAVRAREGLKQSYLAAHLGPDVAPACEPFVGDLPAYVRGKLSKRVQGKTQTHVESCGACEKRVGVLAQMNENMGLVLAAAALGLSAGATYLASGSGAGAVIAGAATSAGVAGTAAASSQGAGGAAGGGAAGSAGAVAATAAGMGLGAVVGVVAAGVAVALVAGALVINAVRNTDTDSLDTPSVAKPGEADLGSSHFIPEQRAEDPGQVLPVERVAVTTRPSPASDSAFPIFPVPGQNSTQEQSRQTQDFSSSEPTTGPTTDPTSTAKPTTDPSREPNTEPTLQPTKEPTGKPTSTASPEPTSRPTPRPTPKPTPDPTSTPTEPEEELPNQPPGEQETEFHLGLLAYSSSSDPLYGYALANVWEPDEMYEEFFPGIATSNAVLEPYIVGGELQVKDVVYILESQEAFLWGLMGTPDWLLEVEPIEAGAWRRYTLTSVYEGPDFTQLGSFGYNVYLAGGSPLPTGEALRVTLQLTMWDGSVFRAESALTAEELL